MFVIEGQFHLARKISEGAVDGPIIKHNVAHVERAMNAADNVLNFRARLPESVLVTSLQFSYSIRWFTWESNTIQ
jgi:hypothetical protein